MRLAVNIARLTELKLPVFSQSSGSRRGDLSLQAEKETPLHLPGNVTAGRYYVRMSRYRLQPTLAQEAILRDHCGHARYVWNLAVEQHAHWHPGRTGAPGYLEQCRQLTAARADTRGWPQVSDGAAAGPAGLRPSEGLLRPGNPAGRPSWRKAGRDEGFRIVGARQAVGCTAAHRKIGQVWVPKAGWVGFRWSRACPPGAKSYRVTMDRAGRWHVAFAVIPAPVPAPGTGQAVGIDRGVAVSAALSTGELLRAPGRPSGNDQRCGECSGNWPAPTGLQPPRAGQARHRPAVGPRDRPAQGLDGEDDHGHGTAVRRDPGRKPADPQHDPVRQRYPGQPGPQRRQKAGLNRGILGSGWGVLVRRLEEKAPGRVEKVSPAFTSQRCSACGQVDAESRESKRASCALPAVSPATRT